MLKFATLVLSLLVSLALCAGVGDSSGGDRGSKGGSKGGKSSNKEIIADQKILKQVESSQLSPDEEPKTKELESSWNP